MADIISKVARLTMMINDNPRITVRRIQAELGLTRSTTYRWLQSVSSELPIRIDDGVVSIEDNGGLGPQG